MPSRLGLRLFLFGSFRLERESRPIRLGTRKVEMLLAYLVLYPQAHSREKLAALFWGDVPDAQARGSLRTALNSIRKRLNTDILLTDRETIQFNLDYALPVDALEFQAGATQFLSADPPEPNLVNLDLYRADLLADIYDEWIIEERDRYRTLYLNTLLRLAWHLRSRGEYNRSIDLAQKVLAFDAANEKAHQHLMFCYVTTGDRNAALRQYEDCQRLLHNDLGVAPSPETTALYHWIKQTSAPARSLEALLTNLPIPLTSFIGRERETIELKQLLLSPLTRLLTLTGAGGCGKTRLAIRVAMDLLDTFKDGVWWVELAALTDWRLVPHAVAKTLGVREVPHQEMREALVNAIRAKHLLLMLDNCEHLVVACAQLVGELLRACPHLKIMGTSREPLGVSGEVIWQVPSLSIPASAHTLPPAGLAQYEAVRLFTERATAVSPQFQLVKTLAPAVTQICQRLDGIPLAIELAAARVKVLSPEQIAAHLDDRFNLLTAGSGTAMPRQQTLRAAIDWSYDLLIVAEQTLLRRLSVFAGGWTLEAVGVVCADGSGHPGPDLRSASYQTLDLLARLADKSLVTVEEQGGATRYRLLETLREYAREALRQAGEEVQACDRHLEFFVQLAEEAEPELAGAKQVAWLNRLELEHANLRAALDYSQSGPIQLGLRLAGALWRFWWARGYYYYSEAHQRLARLLAHPEAQVRNRARAKALQGLGAITHLQGNYAAARPLLEEGLTIYRELNYPNGMAAVLIHLGLTAHELGDDALAQSFYEEGLALFQASGNQIGAASALNNLGHLDMHQNDWGHAHLRLESSLAIYRELGNYLDATYCLYNLGQVARFQLDYVAARSFHEEGLAIRRELGDKPRIAWSLHALGLVAYDQGDDAEAQSDLEQSLVLFQEVGDTLGLANALSKLGFVALRQRDSPQAFAFLRESLRVFQTIGARPGIADCLTGLAEAATVKHDLLGAARLLGAAEAMFATIGANPDPAIQIEYDQTLGSVRTQLAETTLAAARSEGHEKPDETIQWALGVLAENSS